MISTPYNTMSRKAAESWWKCEIPPEVAYYKLYSGGWSGTSKRVPVTWQEIHKERAKKQQSNTEWKRRADFVRRAAILSVNSKNWTRGFALCTTIGDAHHWVDYENWDYEKKMCQWLMDNVPLGVLCFDFKDWKRHFEKKYGKIFCFITLDKRRKICEIEIKKMTFRTVGTERKGKKI